MAERILSPVTYWVVLGILLALTVLTVAVSFIPLPGVWHIVCGLIIATVKATLVVLFFMHVLVSPRLTRVVVLVAITWLFILFTLTLSDYFTRELVPHMPGH